MLIRHCAAVAADAAGQRPCARSALVRVLLSANSSPGQPLGRRESPPLPIIGTMYRFICSLATLCLVACSPALNWRTVSLPALGLAASLPCKPEHLERQIELAGHPAQVRMSGCTADGVTFALACAALAEPAQAGLALTHWRAAVLATLQAPPAPQPGSPQDQPFVPAGALTIPQSVRTVALGQQPGGSSVALQAVWFARVQGLSVQACHAVVYSVQPRPEVAEAFFAGLVLQ